MRRWFNLICAGWGAYMERGAWVNVGRRELEGIGE
jgi:hypothetical protein